MGKILLFIADQRYRRYWTENTTNSDYGVIEVTENLGTPIRRGSSVMEYIHCVQSMDRYQEILDEEYDQQ
jgi:hypothetical protein